LRVFDRQAWDPDIRTVGDEIRLEASFHHLNCLPPGKFVASPGPGTRQPAAFPSARVPMAKLS
jgi:hypothetical protein